MKIIQSILEQKARQKRDMLGCSNFIDNIMLPDEELIYLLTEVSPFPWLLGYTEVTVD